METSKVVKSKAASPDKESWYHFRLKEEQETPKRLEDAAKFLAFMISVSLSIFLAVASKSGFGKAGTTWGISTALIFWILSLLLSFFVLFPFRYRFASESIRTFQEAHQKIVRVKRTLLILSLAFFSSALIILVLLFLRNR